MIKSIEMGTALWLRQRSVLFLGNLYPEVRKNRETVSFFGVWRLSPENKTHFSVLKIHDLPCTGSRRISPMKIAALLKANHRVNTIPIKIPMIFFHRRNKQTKQTLQFIQKHKDPKLHYRALVTKPGWCWHKHRCRPIEQTEGQRRKATHSSHLFPNEGPSIH